jgi:hypothetical protein
MKLNAELEESLSAIDELRESEGNETAVQAEGLRLLEWNELVRRGDFVADGVQNFKLWEGPSGFRADAFVKPTYRRIGAEITLPKLKARHVRAGKTPDA